MPASLTRCLAVLTAAALTLVLASCSGPSTDLDAAGVAQELAKQGLPVTVSVTYTESTDPNKLLGRPNGYTSKTSFVDERVDASNVAGAKEGDVGFGGSVEVFADAGQAEQRADYIRSIGKQMPVLGEYDYVAGPVLVRVSKELTSAQAAEFEAALGKIVS